MKRIRIRDLLDSPQEVEALRERLRRGGLAAIPTETFYGFAADPQSGKGVRRLLAVKERDERKPLLVLFAVAEQLDALGIAADPHGLAPFLAIWPAPLTVVLPLARPIPASCGARTLAVRIPADERVRELLARVGPVTGTSLNRSGEPPCEDPEEVARRFGREVDVLVDGGKTAGGLASTVIDATVEPPRVLRKGALAWPPAGL